MLTKQPSQYAAPRIERRAKGNPPSTLRRVIPDFGCKEMSAPLFQRRANKIWEDETIMTWLNCFVELFLQHTWALMDHKECARNWDIDFFERKDFCGQLVAKHAGNFESDLFEGGKRRDLTKEWLHRHIENQISVYIGQTGTRKNYVANKNPTVSPRLLF